MKYYLLLSTVAWLGACSDATPLDGAKKVATEPVGELSPADGDATLKKSEDENEEAGSVKNPEESEVNEQVFAPIPTASLTCAIDYAGLPASQSAPRYGCRLALDNQAGIPIPEGIGVELNFFAGATRVGATVNPAPARSLWQWYVQTDAKGPLTAQIVLRDADVVVDPVLSLKTGTKKFASDLVGVEGSSLQWVVGGGVANAVGDGNQYRTTVRGLSFTGTFPKFLTVNRETGRPTQMYAGFLIGNERLTCRYGLVPGLSTYYMVDMKTCRRGTVDFEPADTRNPGPGPYKTDLSNPAVKWSLDDLVVGATQWYTDWVITPENVRQLEPPQGVVTTGSIREFKSP